jgi:hypothetical protein
MPTLVWANNDVSKEFWGDITTIYDISDRWQYNGDQGYRTSFSDNKFHLLYFRPSVSYMTKQGVTLHGGVGLFKSIIDNDADVFELRPWAGLQFPWPQIKGFRFSHYFRLEERLFWIKDRETVSTSSLRGRYQLGLVSPTYNILMKNGIFFMVAMELFWPLENSFNVNFSDRIRTHVGVGSRVTDNWRAELQYVVQDGRALAQDSFTRDERIIRLRLFYNFDRFLAPEK